MKLTSVLFVILLGAVASGPALAHGGFSFGRSASPMFHGSQFHSSVRSGFVVAQNGNFHPHFRSSVVIVSAPVHFRSSAVIVSAPVHFRSRVVIIGAPFFAPFYYPYPYYYDYPPVAAMPYSSPNYIEQGGAAPEQSQGYWYYCADAKAYYPYVKDCPGGWLRVLPQAPPASNY